MDSLQKSLTPEDVPNFKRRVLAYKIGSNCMEESCSRPVRFSVRGKHFCTSCFYKFQEKLKAKGYLIIFPSYQEPQFPRIVSNMLTNVKARGHIIGGRWGYRLRHSLRRKGGGRRRASLEQKKKRLD